MFNDKSTDRDSSMFDTTRSNFFRKDRNTSKKHEDYAAKENRDKYKSLYVNSVEKDEWVDMSVHLPKVKGNNNSIHNTHFDEDK